MKPTKPAHLVSTTDTERTTTRSESYTSVSEYRSSTMTAPSPSSPAALSAWVLIACAAFRPALAAPAFPTDRVVLNRRQPSLASGLTSNSPAWNTNAGRPPLGLGGASSSSDQLGRGLRIHGGGSGGRIPGTSSAFFNIDNSAENDDHSAATTDSLGLQLSDEISKCLGTSSSRHAHLSTRGGSTGVASRPEEEQANAIVDTAAKSTKDADDTNNAAQYAKKLKVCMRSSILIIVVHFIFLVWLLHLGYVNACSHLMHHSR